MILKPMLLTSSSTIPSGSGWVYEGKYDGFRCLLEWNDEHPLLKSRTGKVLNQQFPEIINFCSAFYDQVKPFLPIILDGELVRLENDVKSDFPSVQLRGRMRTKSVIMKHMNEFSCHYIAFDLLTLKGEKLVDFPLIKRKKKLHALFKATGWPLSVHYDDRRRIQAIDVYQDSETLWNKIAANNGEGIVAKKTSSTWTSDKRTVQWIKVKNWRYVNVVLTKYDQANGYFHGAVYRGKALVEIVVFSHGLNEEEKQTLISFFKMNGTKATQNVWEMTPSVCVEIACVGFDGKQLREPRFHAFNLEKDPIDCHWRSMWRELLPLPESIQITHPEKPVWPALSVSKDDYLLHLQQLSPYLLPFLKERLLTVIRYPHGATGERFFQKNCPDYAPDFIETEQANDIRYIICNDIETLLWLGNQLALEFHIPFQTTKTNLPTEIVFDLDPPSISEFSLAVEAALRMKAIFDQFHLQTFVKTSGGKGLQVYIPLPDNTFSYKETRLFTEFVSRFLCEQEPNWFTVERLKKNRGNKLYVDYLQHEEGKTIIAPYSPRGNEQGLVATPLNWSEVSESLKPGLFTLPSVVERLKIEGNLFHSFWQAKEEQPFTNVLEQLRGVLQK